MFPACFREERGISAGPPSSELRPAAEASGKPQASGRGETLSAPSPADGSASQALQRPSSQQKVKRQGRGSCCSEHLPCPPALRRATNAIQMPGPLALRPATQRKHIPRPAAAASSPLRAVGEAPCHLAACWGRGSGRKGCPPCPALVLELWVSSACRRTRVDWAVTVSGGPAARVGGRIREDK